MLFHQMEDSKKDQNPVSPEAIHDKINETYNSIQRVSDVKNQHNRNNAPANDLYEYEKNEVHNFADLHTEEKQINEKVTKNLNESPDLSTPDLDQQQIDADRATLANQNFWFKESKRVPQCYDPSDDKRDVISEKLDEKLDSLNARFSGLTNIRELQIKGENNNITSQELSNLELLEAEEIKTSNATKEGSNKRVRDESEQAESSKRTRNDSGENRSLIDDFADVSQEPADYTGGDD